MNESKRYRSSNSTGIPKKIRRHEVHAHPPMPLPLEFFLITSCISSSVAPFSFSLRMFMISVVSVWSEDGEVV